MCVRPVVLSLSHPTFVFLFVTTLDQFLHGNKCVMIVLFVLFKIMCNDVSYCAVQ